MNTLLVVFVITCIAIIIIAVGILIYYIYTRNKVNPNNDISSPNIWSKSEPIVGNPKGNCLLYQFEAYDVISGSTTYVIPGGSNLNLNVLNSMTGVTVNTSCIDVDQIYAELSSRTCQGVTGSTSFCYNNEGQLLSPGDVEQLYVQCGTNTLCPGALALIALNFNIGSSQPALCITKGSSITGNECDITQESQLFRLTRTFFTVTGTGSAATVNVQPASTNQGGYLTQILDRDSQLCLGVDDNNDLSLVNCSTNGGYTWLLTPSFTTTTNTNTPQQIAYVTNTDLISFPTSLTAQELENWISTNNIMSLALISDQPALAPFSLDITTGTNYNTQYITYSIYNTLSTIPTCTAGSTIQPCSSF